MTDRREVIFHIINRGMAWFYRHYAKELRPEDAVEYEKAENVARAGKIGLWTDPSPTPPWDFRRGDGSAKAPGAAAPTTPAAGPVIGNRISRIYHLPGCPNYNQVADRNRVPFKTEAEAQAAGYRKARNCPR